MLGRPDNPNMMIPFYLMASYAYYELDSPIMSDADFDWCCRELDRLWDQVDHIHKMWIDRDDLSAGTKLHRSYPSMAKGAACALAGLPYKPDGVREKIDQCATEIDRLKSAFIGWNGRLPL